MAFLLFPDRLGNNLLTLGTTVTSSYSKRVASQFVLSITMVVFVVAMVQIIVQLLVPYNGSHALTCSANICHVALTTM